jgi:hypothetical protein
VSIYGNPPGSNHFFRVAARRNPSVRENLLKPFLHILIVAVLSVAAVYHSRLRAAALALRGPPTISQHAG